MNSGDLHSKIMGLVFTGTSGVCFACASLFVKLCGDIPISLIILTRSLLQITASLLLNRIFWKQPLYPKGKIRELVCFGVLGFLTVYGIYFAFQEISLGEATVILSTTPLFVAGMERVFLRVPLPGPTILSGVVCSVGVVLLSHSNVSAVREGVLMHRYLAGFGVVTLATITQAATFIIVRLDFKMIIQ